MESFTSKTIAGQRVTLRAGVQYLARTPFPSVDGVFRIEFAHANGSDDSGIEFTELEATVVFLNEFNGPDHNGQEW